MIINYKNSTIKYTVHGKGMAIVLLHGFLETSEMWNALIPELSKNNSVICIDLLGHGQSGCIGYVHTMEDMADAVFTVLKHLNIKKAKCIGHSMGGYVALALAEKQPQLFEGLCLMNSTFEADTNQRQQMRNHAIKMAQGSYKNLVRLSFSNLFAEENKTKHKADYNKALQTALKIPLQSYIAAQRGMLLRPNRYTVFEKINGKKLMILGQKDSHINSKRLINKTKGTAITCTEFSEGHMSHIENKAELLYTIKNFVKQ